MTAKTARQQLADAVRASTGTTSDGLLKAFATVPRERFLPPGPWHVRDAAGTRVTEDAAPSHVYSDASIAVDLSRDLYNGQPSTVARWLDALAITPGEQVLHVGCGTGYYTAIIAELVGRQGRVTAVEIDEDLARAAESHLRDWPWVEVRQGDGTSALPARVDVVVVHAGASHVRPEWLASASDRARLLVPLTVDIPAMGATLGKGLAFAIERSGAEWRARALSFVAIYSLRSARDDAAALALGQALRGGHWDAVTRLRTDRHDAGPTCWCHVAGACLGS